MREIKFRAWDKKNEAYLYDVQNASDMFSNVKCENGENTDCDEECFAGFLYDERYDIEQFTDMKDINGNDVYEGDIVEVYRQGIDEVVFANGSFGLIPNQYHQFEPLSELDGGIKKIGNVHTNHELLEAEK